MQKEKQVSVWSKNFTLLTVATIAGAAGGIASEFALSFLVFDETGSTFKAALLMALNLLPYFTVQFVAAPLLDRLPRKPFLVGGDLVNAAMYAAAGIYLLRFTFSYPMYLVFSLLLSTLNTFDSLAYNSIFPLTIPRGAEHKGYAVSAMIYPVLQVVMAPAAAVLYQAVGVGVMLLLQAVCSLVGAVVESGITLHETPRKTAQPFSPKACWQDLCESIAYLRQEKGVLNLFVCAGVSNGVGEGTYSLLIAFFRTAPGLSVTMYSFFSVAACLGRMAGSVFHYRVKIPEKRRHGFTLAVYLATAVADMLLLWLPYPAMLLNTAISGALGTNTYSIREEAVQRYIPDEQRARINGWQQVFFSLIGSAAALVLGALGEVLDYRVCYTIAGTAALVSAWITLVGHGPAIKTVLEFTGNRAVQES